MQLLARGRVLTFPRRPLIMGIVNLNDDSFCGDGTLDPALAMEQAVRLIGEGADLIDIGAESARTNRSAITIQEELDRLLPFVMAWNARVSAPRETPTARPDGNAREDDARPLWPPLLSINTWRPEVVEAILPFGGDLINDIGALPDSRNARLCARHGAALLIMHSVGLPKEKHTHVSWPGILEELDRFFEEKLALCQAAGLPTDCTVLDPGLDFAKQQADNLTILRDSARLHRFGRPVLMPVSRKTVIGDTLSLPDPLDRDAGTLACMARGLTCGVSIFRVHAVRPAVEALRVLHALTGPSGGGIIPSTAAAGFRKDLSG